MKLLYLGFFLLLFTTVFCDLRPVYQCTISGKTCTFSGIQLNSTHYDWEPAADNPLAIEAVRIEDSVMPIITNNICQKFPNIKALSINGIQVEEVLEDSFNGCTQLEEIFLQDNKIKTLGKKTFYYNTAVKEIYLWGNQITGFADNNIFENMPNLQVLSLFLNNLTEFSPDLIRNNKKIATLYLHSNDLLDVEVEKIIELIPNLFLVYLNDNQILCSRIVQIINYCKKHNIKCDYNYNEKIRYYPTQVEFGEFKCLPDASWMSAHYKVQNAKSDRKLESMKEEFEAMKKQLMIFIDQNKKIGQMLMK